MTGTLYIECRYFDGISCPAWKRYLVFDGLSRNLLRGTKNTNFAIYFLIFCTVYSFELIKRKKMVPGESYRHDSLSPHILNRTSRNSESFPNLSRQETGQLYSDAYQRIVVVGQLRQPDHSG
jgi:hypothetical protein